MKPVLLLLLTSSLMIAASGALAQGDACSNQYGACMDRCSSRPQSLQGSCSQSCEAASNQCYDKVFGGAPQEVPGPNEASAPEPDPRDARNEATSAPKRR